MRLDSFLRILAARWLTIFSSLALCLTAAVIASVLLPKTYSASTDLIMDEKNRDLLSGQSTPVSKSYIATQVDVITSRNVASRVFSTLTPDQQLMVRKHMARNSQSDAALAAVVARYLDRNVQAKPGRDSNVVKISVKSSNPELSALLANGVADAYMHVNLELRTDPAQRYSSWYAQQLELLRENLRTARSELSAYQKAHGIIGVDERLDVENARLRELSSMLVAAQGQRLYDKSRESQSGQDDWKRASADVLESPVVQQLRTELAQAEARLNELSTRLGSRHPAFIQASTEVVTLRSRLTKEVEVISGGVRSAAELSASQAAELERALAEQKQRVLELGAQRDELQLLQQEVATAQEAYNAAASRASASRLESRLAETDVAILNHAVAPSSPSAPDIRLNIVLGSALGLLLGIGLALLLETINRRVRGPADVEETLGLPLLAYLPN